MANAGQLVTNQEVIDFCKTIQTIESGKSVWNLIQAAEFLCFSQLRSTGVEIQQTTHNDEEITIDPGDLRYEELVVRRRNSFRLRFRPVVTFSSLRIVEGYNSVGVPNLFVTIPRSSYHVNSRTGIVTLLEPIVSNFYATFSFPAGTAVMLATYDAGYDLTDEDILVQPQFPMLKQAVLQVISRFHKLLISDSWHEQAQNSEFGIIDFIRAGLAPEDLAMLNGFQRLM